MPLARVDAQCDKEVLDSLTPREAKVLRMRYGVEMSNDHTLEEVGKQFDVRASGFARSKRKREQTAPAVAFGQAQELPAQPLSHVHRAGPGPRDGAQKPCSPPGFARLFYALAGSPCSLPVPVPPLWPSRNLYRRSAKAGVQVPRVASG